MIEEGEVGGLACPPAVQQAIARFCQAAAQLPGGVVGIYLYGSLARGCWHEQTSDVDLLVITDSAMSEDGGAALLRVHREAGHALDVTAVTREQLIVDTVPTPIDFLLKPIEGGRLVRLPEGCRDFLLQRQDAHECGCTLAGRPAREIVPPVPWPALARCLAGLLPHLVPSFKNPTLMLCRVAYACQHRALCSKAEAGEWALEHLEESWQPLIATALQCYAAGVSEERREDLPAFEQYCRALVAGELAP